MSARKVVSGSANTSHASDTDGRNWFTIGLTSGAALAVVAIYGAAIWAVIVLVQALV